MLKQYQESPFIFSHSLIKAVTIKREKRKINIDLYKRVI